jgi:transcriptional regulator with XRE-family HTH domain
MKKTAEIKKNVRLDKYELPERLKYLRVLRGLSQVELAKKSGVSQSTIAQIEGGRKDPSISTLKKICIVFEIQLAVLFAADDVHVFDMHRLRNRYKSAQELNPTLYKAVGEVVRFAKDIGFL